MRKLGKYEILEEVGRGGFAVVYKARDAELDRVVALKVLHPQLTTDPKFVQRFYQEARTAAGLHHPHIVTVHEVGEEAGQHYLAMTFLPGRTLDKWLTEGPLPVEHAVSIVEQVADALDAIHGEGLVHRDVKPGNIMVDDAGQATLLDFGIVRAAEGTRVTTTMAVLGTPAYMAPEQAEIEETTEIDWRADVYALGVVTYEMLAGRPPFIGKSPTAILHKHVYEPPPAPTALNPDLPAGLEPVLLKVLAKGREERFQWAGTFAARLRHAFLAESQIRMRKAQIIPLYEELQVALAKENWGQVARLGSQIQMLDPDYRDVSRLTTKANRQLRRAQRSSAKLRRGLPAFMLGSGATVGFLVLIVFLCICAIIIGVDALLDSMARGLTATPRPPTETIPPATRLPTPVTERTTAVGTWSGFTSDDSVNDLVFHDDLLWVGTSGGVVVWDPERGTFVKYTTLDGLADNYVYAVAVGPDDALWFGTKSGGVSCYDPAANTWQTFTTDHGLADNDVQAIASGPDGVLWSGTSRGVSRYDPAAGTWQTFTTADGLADNDVQAIAVGPDGTLWFGTGGGVNRYDPAARAWRTFTTDHGLADNDVQAIAMGLDDALWFGTSGGGASRYDPAADTWQTFTTADGLPGNYVNAIAVGPDGDLWLAALTLFARGASRYDPTTGTQQTFTTDHGLVSNHVNAIAVGPDGALWFGTWGGVSRLAPASP